MAMERDTIAAVATAPGRAAVGVVRVSGPADALRTLAVTIAGSLPEARRAALRCFSDAHGEFIDSGLLIHFPAPASYTGEDVLEFQVHGSAPVLRSLLAACLDAGARPARPGEFTERAWLNGRMDLLQAEAVADLIDARSRAAARLAQRALGGSASRALARFESRLASAHAHLEAAIDFAEEAAGEEIEAALIDELQQLALTAQTMGAGVERARLQRDGLRVVIVGPPNAGKSSLFNRLLGSDRALVSEEPGTTRDTIDAELLLEGINLRLCDTAGMRSTTNPLEAEGVRRARAQLMEADAWLFVSSPDVVQAAEPLLEELLANKPQGATLLQVMNKADLAPDEGEDTRALTADALPGDEAGEAAEPSWPGHDRALAVSARTGAGIERLAQQLVALAGEVDIEALGLAGPRHAAALVAVAGFLDQAVDALAHQAGPELAAEALRLARRELDALFGRHADPEALLGEIFSRFCIGK